MTLEQQDVGVENARRIQLQNKTPELFEIVRKTSTGYDQRDNTTFYKTERLGVYATELAALRAALKYTSGLTVQPLKVEG